MISRVSNDIVGYMLGRPDLCRNELLQANGGSKEVQRAVQTVVENSCVKKQMLELIRAAP